MGDLAERYKEAKRALFLAGLEDTTRHAAAEAELDAVVREMLDGLYECVELDEETPVRYVGVYVLNWNKVSVLTEPEVAFREVDADAILGLDATDGGEDDG